MTQQLWQPSASLANIKLRANLLKEIRDYFAKEQVIEVATPILSQAAVTDIHLDSFVTHFKPIGKPEGLTLFLHTSPEFHMKRMLAAYHEDIYQICHVFRNGEAGGKHNPEFTMLEWYRVGYDHHQLMDDMTKLLASIANFTELRRVSYQQIFEEHLGINPHRTATQKLEKLVHEKIDDHLVGLERNSLLDLLFTHYIEPSLGWAAEGKLAGVYIYDFPASMAALARVNTDVDNQQVASRFELFINGIELANGYHELVDGIEQAKRFKHDQDKRKELGYQQNPYDEYLLAALAEGLPDCAGVALGVDRLLMLLAQTNEIADVIAFDFERA
ncbi:elongation factor P--(R)-beta-lysine ligase [Endozoicomonas sp. SM1973]|uniref:Elongation factor P--(R)-beta-lysine ligase n=1 Tax=Spartinivicinus marinus TaxID=2994442 RepID=A0A853ICA1_9GAMM|nr:elongation factor P--(R)-beta-lysine ligase [Spartinivicinus marinus]MCX4027567.1 elongation factor P--(R)-beta-lysine ligase [Spartinivicinus marinus]NYZ68188.1 elongation factor P--(R)-beta-lysine ligase [Spartinivicinus marinus]